MFKALNPSDETQDAMVVFTPFSSLKNIIEDITSVDIISVDLDMLFAVLIEDIFSYASNGIDPEHHLDIVVRQTFLTITDTQHEMTTAQLEMLSSSIYRLAESIVENLNLLNMLYERCKIFRYQRTLPDQSILLQST